MKKLILALAMVLAAPFLRSQTISFYTDRAVAPNPFAIQGVNNLLLAIPNGQVRVCTYTVPVGFANCSPLASIFDVNGNPISNAIGGSFGQLTTDNTGRFSFGCTSGSVLVVQVAASFNNSPSLSYPVVCSASSLANILGTNNTWTGTNVFNALVTFNGNINNGVTTGVPGLTSGSNVFWAGCNGTASAGTTLFIGASGSTPMTCTDVGTNTTLSFFMPSAGTLQNLQVHTSTAGVNASSGAFVILKNAAPSGITCTVGTGTSCTDSVHTVAVAASDQIGIRFTTQGGETLANIAVSFEKR